MGRSVDFLRNATNVLYIEIDCEEFTERQDWEYFYEGLMENLKEICPSLSEIHTNLWEDETKIIGENTHCQIGVSCYHSIVSFSILIHDDYRTNKNLTSNWIKQMWPKIEAMITTKYKAFKRIGNMSNGEGVFEKIKPKK